MDSFFTSNNLTFEYALKQVATVRLETKSTPFFKHFSLNSAQSPLQDGYTPFDRKLFAPSDNMFLFFPISIFSEFLGQ